MRIGTALNWTFFCFNVLVLVLLLLMFANFQGIRVSSRDLPEAKNAAAEMGMDVFFAKDPFALFVAKRFPDDASFTFYRHGLGMMLSVDDIKGANERTTKDVLFSLGEEVSVSLHYSYSGADRFTLHDLKIHDLMLNRNCGDQYEAIKDFNADGSYDIRSTWDMTRDIGSVYVFFDNEWQEVEDGAGEYEKKLVDGREVKFDMQIG